MEIIQQQVDLKQIIHGVQVGETVDIYGWNMMHSIKIQQIDLKKEMAMDL